MRFISFWVIVAAGLFPACRETTESVMPTVESLTESVYASGIVKSRDQYQVYPRANGIIESVLVAEGDLVSRGAPIMRISGEMARISAESAGIAAEYATLAAQQEKLQDLELAIEQAALRMRNDSVLLYRQRQLWAQGIGSQQELERKELAYENSLAAYRSAQLRLSDARKQLTFNDRQSRKNLQMSRTQTRDYTVTAENPGRVYRLLKEKGEMVTQQMPVAIIGAAEDFVLELQVDEYDIARVQPGQEVAVTLDSYPGEVFAARVGQITPIMNERSRSFTVEAVFVQRPAVLYPNLTAEANIILRTKEAALTIPRSYLEKDSLVVMPDGTRRRVRTGLKDYQKVEIIEGLQAGEAIIRPSS